MSILLSHGDERRIEEEKEEECEVRCV